MIDTAHQEKRFAAYVIAKLEAQGQGWKVGNTFHDDTSCALYPDDLIAWQEETQSTKWARLCKDSAEHASEVLMDRLVKALEQHGTLQVLKRGFSISGCGHIDLSAMKAANRQKCTYADQLKTLLAFKTGLGHFYRTYSYVTQLIDFGDPSLENFAASASLLQKRLENSTREPVWVL
ncbi:hypothetical protein SK355_09570 [Candidatus Fukatsuia symbiotica]|uniref:Uncharacterized protein n=1 Tax=Candidatus Fukatsuia symbiotica TaxID=1878942 RepID=A0A2U8I3F3_9GAMM|nr:hypothetical protein [Candidatus Fukatsuia symbiotica]AWK13646.1 hypothetical protein CCS41_02690 [Candidatus Fukatsuia symbiotica]MEA9445464.1 hypothetical protein [Candidatus Fukatsuia symbiotica]